MEFVQTSTVPPAERTLAKWNKAQWFASRASLNFAVLQLAFYAATYSGMIIEHIPAIFMDRAYPHGLLGAGTAIISSAVAALGMALLAPRPGANWKTAKRRVSVTYAGTSLLSFLASGVQVGLAVYLFIISMDAFKTIPDLMHSQNRWFSPARSGFLIILAIGYAGMILAGLVNALADIACFLYALRLV